MKAELMKIQPTFIFVMVITGYYNRNFLLMKVLIHNPKVLILDEPAAGLDPRARVELRELVHLLATEMDKTVLISSHILTELGEICDSALIIEAGQLLAGGTIKDIQAKQRQESGRKGAATLVVRLLESDSLEEQIKKLEIWMVQQPHVVEVNPARNSVAFEFDGSAADQHQLLKNLLDEGFSVCEFHGKSESLEDAFMNITRGIVQ